MDIHFSGEKLEPMQKNDVVREAEKLASKHDEILDVAVNVKEYNKASWGGKYSIHLNAKTKHGFFNAEAAGWTLWLAVKSAMGKLRKELSKKQIGVKKATMWHKKKAENLRP